MSLAKTIYLGETAEDAMTTLRTGDGMGSVYRKIRKSIIKRGVFGTIQFAVQAVISCIQKLSPAYRKAFSQYVEADREFDRKFGVDTAGTIPLGNLHVSSENWIYGAAYQPVSAFDFGKILEEFCIPYEKFLFIDLGAGKGRAALLAASLPFKKIIGVEFCEDLVKIAEYNVTLYPEEQKKCKNFEFIYMDASVYPIPLEPLVLFMNNPFDNEIMEKVMKNVGQSLSDHQRRIVFMYFTPIFSDVWDRSSCLKRVRTVPGLVIYDTYALN